MNTWQAFQMVKTLTGGKPKLSQTLTPEMGNNLNSFFRLFLSVLQMEDVFKDHHQCSEEEKLQRLLTLNLRYFTPREVANLMGFPQSFCKLEKNVTYTLIAHLYVQLAHTSLGSLLPSELP